MKVARHDRITLELERLYNECGRTTQREVCGSLESKSRPDLLVVAGDGAFVTDVTITCPARVTIASTAPFAAAINAATLVLIIGVSFLTVSPRGAVFLPA